MSDKTKIEWTESTWNPVTGCTKVSQGCKHCYAERDWARMQHVPSYSGRKFTDVACHPERLDIPLRWKKPRLIFVNSMSDLFHESVPGDFIEQVFGVIALAKQHTFQILTKRPDRMRSWLSKATMAVNDKDPSALTSYFPKLAGYLDNPVAYHTFPLPNVWLGVSVEDQQAADERIPLLLQTPAAVRWISAEPLLGPVDLTNCGGANAITGIDGRETYWADFPFDHVLPGTTLDWVVVGGESGPNARPMHPDWARSLRDQCAAAEVPFLFKQWGEWQISSAENGHHDCNMETNAAFWLHADGARTKPSLFRIDGKPEINPYAMVRVGKKRAGRLLGGAEHNGYPKVKS